jgi:hypothetical protein
MQAQSVQPKILWSLALWIEFVAVRVTLSSWVRILLLFVPMNVAGIGSLSDVVQG